MLTITEHIRPQEIHPLEIRQNPMPACTREEAARLLETLRCDYHTLSLRARSQVKILMSALTNVQFNAELR